MLDPSNPKHIKSLEKCMSIKEEIMKFGVNENELLKIIENLSYELENTILMREILNLLKNSKENIKKENIIL